MFQAVAFRKTDRHRAFPIGRTSLTARIIACMTQPITFIGFGEAAEAFAFEPMVELRAYDIKTDAPTTREAKQADYSRAGVQGCQTAADALRGVHAALSLVTADHAREAARDCAGLLDDGALWFDLNSVAPGTKCAAAAFIVAAGARYVDVAVMAPVLPLRRAVPLILSGPHALAGSAALMASGFTNVRIVPGGIGAAASIKMIRSVMVKGLEALTAEWILAAEAAGIRNEAIAALNASWPAIDWGQKASYNLERMMVHGHRRAGEMDEVAKTLDALGIGSAMARATAERQRAIGNLGIAPGDTLSNRLEALLAALSERSA